MTGSNSLKLIYVNNNWFYFALASFLSTGCLVEITSCVWLYRLDESLKSSSSARMRNFWD